MQRGGNNMERIFQELLKMKNDDEIEEKRE